METEEMWILLAAAISVAVLFLLLLLNLFNKTTFKDLHLPSSKFSQITKNNINSTGSSNNKNNLQRRLVLEILMSAGCPKSLHLQLEETAANPPASLAVLTNLAATTCKWNASALLRDILKPYDRLDSEEEAAKGSVEAKRDGDPGALVAAKAADLEPLHVTVGGTENKGTFKAMLESEDENCGALEVEVKISADDVAAAGLPRGGECPSEWAVAEAEAESESAGVNKMKKKKNRKKKGPSAQKKMEELGGFIMAKSAANNNDNNINNNAGEGELGCTCGTVKGDYHRGSCPYPFTSSASVIQRRIKQQYDELVHSNAARSLTLAQVGRFTNCLVEAKTALQQKSETIQRKFTIAKSLLAKADKSSFDRICGQIYRLETEQKRLEEDTIVYNRLQEQLKLSPAYQKMVEYGRTHFQSQQNMGQLLKSEAEDDEISFEELLAQEKKDSFWQKHGRFRPSVPVS